MHTIESQGRLRTVPIVWWQGLLWAVITALVLAVLESATQDRVDSSATAAQSPPVSRAILGKWRSDEHGTLEFREDNIVYITKDANGFSASGTYRLVGDGADHLYIDLHDSFSWLRPVIRRIKLRDDSLEIQREDSIVRYHRE